MFNLEMGFESPACAIYLLPVLQRNAVQEEHDRIGRHSDRNLAPVILTVIRLGIPGNDVLMGFALVISLLLKKVNKEKPTLAEWFR